jgi:molybdopterin adenylyltransferase
MSDAVVLTVSDRRSAGQSDDASGPAAADSLESLGFRIAKRLLVPDDLDAIKNAITPFLGRVALIITTGGTGIGPRDVTPDALRPFFDRELPGFGEIMRTGTYARTPLAVISRGGAGLARGTLIVMLPGSPKAVRECLDLLGPAIRHVAGILAGAITDCATDASQP